MICAGALNMVRSPVFVKRPARFHPRVPISILTYFSMGYKFLRGRGRMKNFQKLYDDIQYGEAAGLTSRLLRLAAAAVGAFRRRLPDTEMTAAEFMQTFPQGAYESMEEFLAESAAQPKGWQDIPEDLVGENVIEAANRAMAQDFSFMGASHRFTGEMDWHYSLGKAGSYPRQHWSEIPFRTLKPLGDIKPCWELNRHQFFVSLALAARKTGNDAYAAKAASFLHSWCDQNPPETGVNYISGLEIGTRCLSWIFTDRILRGHQAWDDATRERLWRNLYSQAAHLAEFLTYGGKRGRNHHLVGAAAALCFIALERSDWQESTRWLKKGLNVLWPVFDDQVYPDGMHFESSFGYHMQVLEFILIVFCEMRQRKVPVPGKVYALLGTMGTVLRLARQPDGELPDINDNDNAGIMPLPLTVQERMRGIMAVLSAQFQRPDFKAAADDHWPLYAHLACGESGREEFDILEELGEGVPLLTSHNSSNIHVLRSGGDYLLFKNNPDPAPQSGHNHADLLSILLFLDGEQVLADAGTYKFGDDDGFRNALRATAAHNTVTVDGKGQAEPVKGFGWEGRMEPGQTQAVETDDAVIIDGLHESYEDIGVTHRRVLVWFKSEAALAVIDQMQGDNAHSFTQHWHFGAGAAAKEAGHCHYRITREDRTIAHIRFLLEKETDRHEIVTGSEKSKSCYISPRYGEIAPGTVLRHAWASTLSPTNSSHRITLFSKKKADPAFGEVWHGEYKLFGWTIDLTQTPATVQRTKD